MMKANMNWFDKWENEKDDNEEIRMIETEIDKAIKEYDECETKLKSVRYRITLLNERLDSLKE